MMQFWPLASTWMTVCPGGLSSRLMSEVSTPFSLSVSMSSSPPVPQMPACQTGSPAFAMATDWLSPLPPAKVSRPVENIVSPGPTMCSRE